jgi:YesN/AraC family two-component response regulator
LGEGTGIGLTLVQELIHLLGGSIEVSSEPGNGSCFLISLPVTRQAPVVNTTLVAPLVYTGDNTITIDNDHPIQTESIANGLRPRLLIIEDSPDVIKYLRTCLEESYDLNVAMNGVEGIELATETIPDIIISDVMMPLADGFEVCNTLKLDERTSHIPIILLTAKADITSRIEGLKRGADAYIAKPFHKQELLVELQKLVALRRLLQSRYRSPDVPEASDDPATQIEDAFIQKFRAVVEANLDDPDFDVSSLCKALGISRTQLHRKMTALTGMSTSEFQKSIRLNRAQTLLQSTDQNVSEIAYAVGFRDPNYFSKAFSNAYGLSPSQFRASASSS